MKLKGLSDAETAELLPPNPLIFVGYRGSVAHGMYVPNSDPLSIDDKDLLLVFAGLREHYHGFGRSEDWERFIGVYDVVGYELRKFVSLLVKQNPNVLSALWLAPHYILKTTPAWRMLVQHRDLFASKAAYHSFTGYAHGQFKRMTHYKFEGYMGEKRKTLVTKFGYDVKNAAHLIRLLRMGIEFLTDGALHVERKDANDLLSIKRGEWALERVKQEADRLFVQAKEAYMRSPLPANVDRSAVEDLLVKLVTQYV